MTGDAGSPLGGGWVATVEEHPTLPSTSDRALELCRAGAARLPLLIVAQRQTAGRGRLGRAWFSDDRGATFTLAIDAAAHGLRRQDAPLVPSLAALAVVDAGGPGCAAQLKWPNDVLYNGRKLAGVLIESPHVAGDPRRLLVIGVGINVVAPPADAPPEVRAVAASLGEAAGEPLEVGATIQRWVAAFARRLERLAAGDSQVAEHRGRCALSGKRVVVQSGATRVAGECAGIDDRGRLLLATPAGVVPLETGTVVAVD